MIDTREGMVRSTTKEALNWPKDMAPALAVLLVTFMFSFMYGDSALLTSWQAACKAPLRFFRFALVLSLPLYALPRVYRFIIQKKASALLQIERGRGADDPAGQALDLPAIPGDRDRATLRHEAAYYPSDNRRTHGRNIPSHTGRPLSIWTPSHDHRDHDFRLSFAIHPLDT